VGGWLAWLGRAAGPGTTLRFLAVFACLVVAGFAALLAPGVDAHVVVPLTRGIAWATGETVRLLGSTAEVRGVVIQHADGFALAIARRCAGLEAVVLLWAGIAAFPAGWRERLLGMAAAALAVMLLNLARIVSLYYLGQYSQAWFDWAHLYAWDALIMVPGLGIFLSWIHWLPSRRDSPVLHHVQAR
jgi:exosortase H (IPTLxxWG-CTERM-specific)